MVVRRGTAKNDRLTSAWSSSQNGSCAFDAADHRRTRNLKRTLHQEDFGWITHFFETGFFHFKYADFIGRAETIFDGAQNAERMAAFTLEVEHGVDHVLEQARAGNGAVLSNVTDQEGR